MTMERRMTDRSNKIRKMYEQNKKHKQRGTQTQHKHNKAAANTKMVEELEKSVGMNNDNGMFMSKLLGCCAVARPCVISLCDLVAFPL